MGHLPENGCVTGGRILINGENVVGLDEPGLRRLRGAAVAMVYQDPAAALNPVMTIGRQLKEALDAHRRLPAATARAELLEVLARVRLPERSEERRVGKEWVSTCRSRWSPSH